MNESPDFFDPASGHDPKLHLELVLANDNQAGLIRETQFRYAPRRRDTSVAEDAVADSVARYWRRVLRNQPVRTTGGLLRHMIKNWYRDLARRQKTKAGRTAEIEKRKGTIGQDTTEDVCFRASELCDAETLCFHNSGSGTLIVMCPDNRRLQVAPEGSEPVEKPSTFVRDKLVKFVMRAEGGDVECRVVLKARPGHRYVSLSSSEFEFVADTSPKSLVSEAELQRAWAQLLHIAKDGIEAITHEAPLEGEALQLFYLDSLTKQQIADQTKQQANTIEARLSRGREKLGLYITDLLEHPDHLPRDYRGLHDQALVRRALEVDGLPDSAELRAVVHEWLLKAEPGELAAPQAVADQPPSLAI